jgi:hypothetical protein
MAAEEATTVRSKNRRNLAAKIEAVSVERDTARIPAGCNIAAILVTDMSSTTFYISDARPPPKFLPFSVIGTTVRF